MNIKDINDIINAVCPNDEDYEKPCISPKYLRQELEQLALDQEQKYFELEPTTENCESCEYYGSHHEVCNYCYKCSLWTEKEPTTKNDLGVREFKEIVVEYPPEDLCTYPEYKGKPYFSIKYEEGNDCIIGYGTYNPQVLSRYLKDYFMPTTKNDLGVDCVSRQAVDSLVREYLRRTTDETIAFYEHFLDLPSVTPQEPKWIPVSEYLPVTNDEVLVTYIVNGNAKKRYVETANCYDGEWSSVNDEYRMPNTKIEIIAWCEMPKPYKAESEDKE